jgi:hypothetical protein
MTQNPRPGASAAGAHMPFWEAPDRFDRELAGLARSAGS